MVRPLTLEDPLDQSRYRCFTNCPGASKGSPTNSSESVSKTNSGLQIAVGACSSFAFLLGSTYNKVGLKLLLSGWWIIWWDVPSEWSRLSQGNANPVPTRLRFPYKAKHKPAQKTTPSSKNKEYKTGIQQSIGSTKTMVTLVDTPILSKPEPLLRTRRMEAPPSPTRKEQVATSNDDQENPLVDDDDAILRRTRQGLSIELEDEYDAGCIGIVQFCLTPFANLPTLFPHYEDDDTSFIGSER